MSAQNVAAGVDGPPFHPLADPAAYAEFYAQQRVPVRRAVVRLLRDMNQAEDVVQEAFLNAWRALRSGAWPERPAAWLFRIATNQAISYFRSERHLERGERGVGAASDQDDGDVADWLDDLVDERVEHNPGDCIEGRELGRLLGAASTALTTEQRQLLHRWIAGEFTLSGIEDGGVIAREQLSSRLTRLRKGLDEAMAVIELAHAGCRSCPVMPWPAGQVGPAGLTRVALAKVRRHVRLCPACKRQLAAAQEAGGRRERRAGGARRSLPAAG